MRRTCTIGHLILSSVAVSAAALLSCSSPTRPSPPPSHDLTMVLRPPSCTPAGKDVRCTVLFWNQGTGDHDVTSLATWSVSSAPFSISPTSVAAVSAPGLIVPLADGDVYIRVDYLGQYALAPHSYAMSTASDAVPLAPYLSGEVTEADGTTPISGATVQIISGAHNEGKSTETLAGGGYSLDHIWMNVPFAVQASKPGYVPQVKTNPGITDDATGYPSNNQIMNFALTRSPS
ncbi:MAG: carboxypeptidase regulatory-like domain-containing protein [Acidobacteriota bacterium]|nr:carboxypeptidase regulatory-like domain-containing protein [Acidobacteriota bacterium]